MTWPSVRLADVADVRSGDGAPQELSSFSESGTPFVRAGSLVPLLAGASEYSLELIPQTVSSSRRMKTFAPGTVVFAKSGMSCTKGLVYQLVGPAHVVNHLAAIECGPELDSRFLLRWFQRFSPSRLIANPAYPSVKISAIRDEKVPLPPLAEQKRIAGILDAADALRAKRRESLAQLDTLLQSTFLDMFGDPVTNPMGWKVGTIEQVGSVQGGLQISSKRRSLPIERPYLRVANVLRGYLDLDEIKTIRVTEAEARRTELEDEDVLFVEGHGNREEIGRCARWDGSIEPCVHQNHLIRLRCDRSKFLPVYVESYMNSEGGRRALVGTSRTTSGLNTISVSKVKVATLTLPPRSVQHHFADIVESIELQKARLRAHLAELDTLFAALQSRAFSGEL